MQKRTKEIRYFFYSQAFADGLRISFAILLPALLSLYYGFLDLGMSISLGALCVSLTDAPGPIIHKKNGMLICSLFVFLVAAITPFATLNPWIMGIEIVLVSFFFSMFSVYGNRATAVGNAAILVMILTMDQPVQKDAPFLHSLLILAGGLWYLCVSLLFYNIQPYRPAQRVLGESLRELAAYLLIKADFYNPATNLDADYQNLVTRHIQVSEKQDAVREILFKTRQIVKETTPTGRKLVWTFVETVDLFEDITASYYDYYALRKRFGHTGTLEKISSFIRQIARELDRMGIAIQLNAGYKGLTDYDSRLKALKEEIDGLRHSETENNLVLKKILVNLRKLVQRVNELNYYFEPDDSGRKRKSGLDHSHFVSHQPLEPIILWNNITFESSVFKHALRVAMACTVGFIMVQTIAYGDHSYWILLTIAFILKPAFSLTKQRNIERIIGTVAGGAIGVLILVFIPNRQFHFALMVLFMIGTYSFLRTNYLAMVVCVTPYVMILFSFLGIGFAEVATERIIDTVIGCAIAFSASYFLFPTWESDQIRPYMKGMMSANLAYLQKIMEGLLGKRPSLLDYKLVRKEVYVSSANLTAAFQRMLSEPKSKQKNIKQIHQFVVMSHILFSNIANVATTLMSKEARLHPLPLVRSARKSLAMLQQAAGSTGQEEAIHLPHEEASLQTAISADDLLLREQLDFIYKLIVDIDKAYKLAERG
ncbi:MAG TPA: FUSC family membrane protein [Flavisolibacter sp.]|nr:FUSC family membrane protein [Flavisolibacter sp.]